MRYFITGCSGLIGSHIARYLLRSGAQISALTRNRPSAILTPSEVDQIRWIQGDLADYLLLEEAIGKVDRVIHSAGFVSMHNSDMEKLNSINVAGTAHIVNACMHHHKPLCHISSVAALGIPENTLSIDESARWEPSGDHSAYAISKKMAEQEVWRGIEEGLLAVIVCPSVVLGTGDWQRSSLQLISYVASSPSYAPPGRLNYVDVRDVAQASIMLMNEAKWGERFILSAGSIAFSEFFAQLSAVLGSQSPSKIYSPWQAKAAYFLSKIAAFLQGKKPKITREILQSSASKHTYMGSKLTQKTGMQYRGLTQTLAWIGQGWKGQQRVLKA